MSLIFRPIDEANARTFISWRYDLPYDFYHIPASAIESVSVFIDPHNAYFSISNEHGTLEAFCCFGADAQVPGGDYDTDALDVGWGLRPDLTGQGHGSVGIVNLAAGHILWYQRRHDNSIILALIQRLSISC